MKRLLDLTPTAARAIRLAAFALSAGVVVLSLAAERFGWLDYKPGGASFDTEVRPILTVVFGVAIVTAIRWEIIGGAIASFAAAAVVAFATHQLVATHAIAVTAAFLLPAVLWILIDLHDLPPPRAVGGLGLAALAAIGGFAAGSSVYDFYWGPTHPSSTIAALPDSPLEWVWSGSVTTTEAEVRAKPRDSFSSVRLAVSTSADLDEPTWIDPRDAAGRVIGFDIQGLTAATDYHYAIEVDGRLDLVRTGTFRTFPDGPASFTVAVGSCARVGSNGQVFDAIRATDPLLYLITGDLHYGDNGRNDIRRYQEVMDLTLAMPSQSALYRSTPVAYVWDDHDYGGNDADGSSPSRQAAMAAYREHVPSYDLAGDESAIYQAFTVGRVRFVLTDARSARNLDNDTQFTSMLGTEQKEWLKNELLAGSRDAALVVWVNPVPWVADEQTGADHWGGYAAERTELADFIADNEIDNLMMVSGDAHMVAIDDGTNTNYGTDRKSQPGFPLLHAAPLDRRGSTKGGPYTHGPVAEGGQFATIEIDDDGNEINVILTARSWRNEQLLQHGFTTTG